MATIGYYAPTNVIFGAGAEEQVGEVLKGYGASKVLIHFGSGSVRRTGLLDKVEQLLTDSGIGFVELGGVVPNPRVSLVRKGIEIVDREGIDFILAVGGGSVLDSSKAIGYGAYAGGDVWDFYCGKRKVEGTVPVGAILTLAATGSEMSDSSVITNDETDPIYKRGVNTDFGRVKFALLNPELTYTVSQYQTACGATDIMMHTLERYFHEGGSLDFTDQLSFTLLREVMANAPVALEHPDDYDARANIMWCFHITDLWPRAIRPRETGHAIRSCMSCRQKSMLHTVPVWQLYGVPGQDMSLKLILPDSPSSVREFSEKVIR